MNEVSACACHPAGRRQATPELRAGARPQAILRSHKAARTGAPGGPRRSAGFTLMEIMIAVAIVAVLARIALPTYQSYVLRGKVSQAFSQLSALSVGLQQVYQDNRSYSGGTTNSAGCLTSGAGAAPTTNTGDFTYSCTLAASTFTITATGKTGTSVANYVYTLDNTGARATTTYSGATFPSNGSCWVASSSGACY